MWRWRLHRAAPPSLTESQQIPARDPGPPTQSTQGAQYHEGQTLTAVATTSSQPPSTPTPLTIIRHPNPLWDVRMGERQPLQHVPPPAAVTRQPQITTAQRPSPPFPPHDQTPVLSPQSPHHPPVPHEQQGRPIPPSTDNTDTLDPEDKLNPRDIGSIPRPPMLTHTNLRAAMRLDGGGQNEDHYNKIRVSMLTQLLHLL